MKKMGLHFFANGHKYLCPYEMCVTDAWAKTFLLTA